MLAVCVALGCVTTGAGRGEQAQVRAVLTQWKAAFQRGDVPGLMTLYADRPMVSGKSRDAVKKDFEELIAEEPIGSFVINVENADVIIKDGKASVLPISVCGRAGSDTIRLALEKQGNRWVIIDMDSK